MNPDRTHLLVVDDCQPRRAAMIHVLKGMGFLAIDEAADGHEGLTLFRHKPYDVVITDSQLPRVSGIELLCAIRRSEERAATPVLLLSGNGTAARSQVAIDEGANGVVAKPFLAAEFCEELLRVVSSLPLTAPEAAQVFLELEEVRKLERAPGPGEGPDLALRARLMIAVEAILLADGAGTLVFANQGAAQLFGFEPDELVGLPVETLVPERMRAGHAKLRASFTAAPASRPKERDRELIGRRKDGTEFPLAVSLTSMALEGEAPLVLAFVTDLTRRRQAEREIRDYQDKVRRMTFDAAVVAEQERRRIALNLHDRVGQSLAIARLKLLSISDSWPSESRMAVNDAIKLLEEAASETRTLSFELSPPILYELGLGAALSWLAEDLEQRHELHVELHDDGGKERLRDTTAAVLFRTVRELLMNVIKHAKVPRARVSLWRSDDQLHVAVENEGSGFVSPMEKSALGGLGLFSAREQLASLGGALEVGSAPGGARVMVRVPLKEQVHDASVRESRTPDRSGCIG